MKLNIITGGDSKYFDLINELCISIEKLEDKNLKISVLDFFLRKILMEEQLELTYRMLRLTFQF